MSRAERIELAGLLLAIAAIGTLLLGLWLVSTALALITAGVLGLVVGVLVVHRAQQIDGDA